MGSSLALVQFCLCKITQGSINDLFKGGKTSLRWSGFYLLFCFGPSSPVLGCLKLALGALTPVPSGFCFQEDLVYSYNGGGDSGAWP